MDAFASPRVAVGLGLAFMLVFRRGIAGLLSRTKRVGSIGLEPYGTPQVPASRERPDALAEFMGTYDNPLLREQEASPNQVVGVICDLVRQPDNYAVTTPERASAADAIVGQGPSAEDLNSILSLPLAVPPAAVVLPPNEQTTLHAGRFELRQGRRRVEVNGAVTLHWLPKPQVRFAGVASIGQARLNNDRARLFTEPRGLRSRAYVLGSGPGFGPIEHRYSGILNGVAVIGLRRPVSVVRFHLVNFPDYIGGPVRFESNGDVLASASRLALSTSDLDVTIDQVPDCTERLLKVRIDGGFAITHTGEVRNASRTPVSFEEAQQVMSFLHFFQAFLAGHWVGPVLVSGQGRRAPVWQTYASWKATPSVRPRSWFPNDASQDVTSLTAAFRRLWHDPLWNRALRTTIHWYVQSNSESDTLEAAIVTAFIPLELLAWLVIVEDGRHMTTSQFKKLNTKDRIGRLLQVSGIPSDVPAHFPRLRTSGMYQTHRSGPGILTTVRNALIHPRRSKRNTSSVLGQLALFELKELALSYVELTLLRAMGYRGRYARRGIRGWRSDQLARVPWA